MSARALSSVGRLLRPVHRVRPNISNAGPSSYRQCASDTRSIAKLYDRKGKLPQALFAESPIPSLVTSTLRRRRRQQGDWSALLLRQDTITRSFHATARRDALPLLPAGVAILKSTSILTLITAISRVLISFFPIGTIAAFRMLHGVKWLSSETQRPEANEEAEEFWRMWCEGERGSRVTQAEAESLLKGKLRDDGGIEGPDGRIAWQMPIPPGSRGHVRHDMDQEKMNALQGDQRRRAIRWIRHFLFFLPPLPPASEVSFSRLTPSEQGQVEALRRYWVSLRMFKDRLAIARWIVGIAVGLPVLLLAAVYVAALERVPFSGRWRIILLTPEEEETISHSLEGPGWYRSVINLLTTKDEPAPPLLPENDWRWHWVESVLRRLEAGLRGEIRPLVSPPPAEYPLKPRPRVSARLHAALPASEHGAAVQEHLHMGPPYNLMILQKHDKNAFSYGFGGQGASGVVVYSGLLDDILGPPPPAPAPRLFGSLFGSAPAHPIPTAEQNLRLALVLAHEVSHLLLHHQLETLSQQQVLWPSLTNLSLDLVRAFVWPLTFILGPTLNDALASVGKTSADEMIDRYGEIGFQFLHELEADRAALRVLALAGFDPQEAAQHFRRALGDLHEIQPIDTDNSDSWTGKWFKLWSTATHPSAAEREAAVQKELASWPSEISRV